MDMKSFVKKFWFDFLFAGATIALGANALKHESHPGAALWVIAFILEIYLRDYLRNDKERLELYREHVSLTEEQDSYSRERNLLLDKQEMSFQRDVNHLTYDEDTDKWTKTTN